jgi:hypothetical protein
MRNYIKVFKADLSLVCIFVGNDITGLPEKAASLSFLRKEFWHVFFVPKRILAVVKGLGIKKISSKKNVSQDNNVKSDNHLANDVGKVSHIDEKPTFNREAFIKVEKERLEVCLRKGISQKLDKKYNHLFSILSKMKTITAGKLLVCIIPDEFQVNDKLWKEITSSINANKEGRYMRTRPQKEIISFCKTAGINFIDLYDILKKENSNSPVYHLQDTHWNVRGHNIASRAIADKIKSIIGRSVK